MSLAQEDKQDSQEEGPTFQGIGPGGDTVTFAGYPEIDYPDREDEGFLDCLDDDADVDNDDELPEGSVLNPLESNGNDLELPAGDIPEADLDGSDGALPGGDVPEMSLGSAVGVPPAGNVPNPSGWRGVMSEEYTAELNDRDISEEELIEEEEDPDMSETLMNTPARQPGEIATMMPEDMEG